MVWLPPSDSRHFLNRLFEFQGCQSYLIKVPTNAAPYSLPIKGRVILPGVDWFPHGLNLVGMPVNSNNPPTFTEFLAFTPEVDTDLGINNQLFTINSAGRGMTIVQPARDKIEPGRAYWIGCARDPKYMGPIHVQPLGGGSLDFGSSAVRQELTIRNTYADQSIPVRVVQTASETPSPGFPELAGPVELSYMTRNSSNRWEWFEFPSSGLTQTIEPGGSWTLYLGIRRQDMPDYVPSGTNGAAYQSILEVMDTGESLMVRVPVVAEKVPPIVLPGDHYESEGLWVGDVVLDQVNAPAYTTNDLLPTPAPMSFRLIVHVNSSGESRLLQQVLLAWDSSLTNAPYTNGAYALFIHDADVPPDSEEVNRISSVAFPLMDPLWLTGSFSNLLTGTITIGFDDPTNPYLHRYHPMHDNKDWDFQPYTNAVETPIITREITLDFDAPPTNLVHHPYWGVDQAMGTYHETMTGLRAQPIFVEGAFYLKRITRINELQ